MLAVCSAPTSTRQWPLTRRRRRAAAAAPCRHWRRHASSSDAPDQPPASSSGSSGADAGGGGSTYHANAWQLMGRMMGEERAAVAFDHHLNTGLALSAAARESGLDADQFDVQLQRLLVACPFLQQRIVRMRPKLLAALAADPDLVATRLVELCGLLPGADVAGIACARPSLLLDPEWGGVPAAVAALARHYDPREVAHLASQQPLLLAESVDDVLAELQRFAGGGDARGMLLAQPSLVLSVQRGSQRLGPGAEF